MSNPYLQNTVFGLHWQQKIRETNQLIRDNPSIQPAFRTWYSNYLQRYGKAPEPPYTIKQVERLLYNQQQQNAMALATRFKRTRYDPFAGISDAEANAAADAALRAIKRPRFVTIRKPNISFPSRSTYPPKIGELKGVDTNISSAAIVNTTNTNANIIGINLINQGSGSFNRVGRKVYPRSVRLTGQLNVTATSNVANSDIGNVNVRCVLVWDKNPNGTALPQFDSVFGHTDAVGTETAFLWDAIRYDSTGRFKILKEFVIKSPTSSTYEITSGNAQEYICSFDQFYKFKSSYETIYASTQVAPTAPLYTDISTGGLFLVYRVSVPSGRLATDYTVNVTEATARFRFTD